MDNWTLLTGYVNCIDDNAELREQLAEARGIAGELARYLRADVNDSRSVVDAYMRIRPSVRRLLER